MNIHEYQAKELLRGHGLPTPRGVVVTNIADVTAAAQKLQAETGTKVFVLKAQIHAGGRGAGHFAGRDNEKGGVRLIKTIDEVKTNAAAMLGQVLVTKQTGAVGREVKTLYIEEGASIGKEFYLSLLIDRATDHLTFVLSSAGGMNIEDVAHDTPDKIIKWQLPSLAQKVDGETATRLAQQLSLPAGNSNELQQVMNGLLSLFIEKDCSLIEVNPLVLTTDNKLLLLDAKISFDDNGLFRHPDVAALRDDNEEEPMEREASANDLSYIKLDGTIGCMVNGAGLAMATLDIIKQQGAEPANFLDVGGGATEARVKKAFEIILSDKHVKGVLVNIFGGIMRCDIIAAGIIAAVKNIQLNVPLVVRLEGTNVELGKKLLTESGLPIITASDLGDAATKIVAAAAK
ncbi:MAG: ADP-forming succinate--CoA ligase subunit beta [Hydrotalea sp.]|nr:ADP-forming succinate--CoA ligase subunit beta [Hydrotalea sp.]